MQVRAKLHTTKSNAGQSAEHLVASDLLARGLHVTKPLNVNTPHDLHVKTLLRGWTTVQVKAGSKDKSTGTLGLNLARHKVTSDIIAVVFLPTREIRYIPNTIEVPPELQTDLTVFYTGGTCQSSSSTVPAATRKPKSSSSTATRRKHAPVAVRSTRSNGARPRKLALENLVKLED